MPRVTVVIPTYNWSQVLPSSIGSVLDQTFSDFELMVVGDGCTDDSADVVARFDDPRVHWVNLPVNTKHQSGPNNEAIRRSDSELIAYCGHDDLWLPNHLEVLVPALGEVAGMGHSSVAPVRPDGTVHAWPRLDWTYRQGDWLAPASVVHHRSLAEAVGGWRPPQHTGSIDPENDLWSRMSAMTGRAPTWVRKVTALKLTAAWRPGVYAERPHHEQQRWLQRIRGGETLDHLLDEPWDQPARTRGRKFWPRRRRGATRQTAEQRWRELRQVKGLEPPDR